MHKSRESLAKSLDAALKSGKQTKTGLSDDTGIGRSSIDGYLERKNAATLDNLDKIATVLGVEPWELLKGADTPLTSDQRDILRFVRTAQEPDIRRLAALMRALEGTAK